MNKLFLKLISLLLCLSMVAAPILGCTTKPQNGDDGKNDDAGDEEIMGEIIMGTYTNKQLREIKEKVNAGEEPWKKAYENLLSYIKTHFNDQFTVDEDFNVPGYYVDAEGHQRAKERLNAIGCMAYACSLAYAIGGEAKYSEKAVELLNSWSTQNKTVSGADGALSMSYIAPSLVFAAELLTGSGGWTDSESDVFKSWLNDVLLPTANSIRERENNWGDWGMLSSVACYNYLGNTEEVNKCFLMIMERIENTILPTGEMPHESKRETNGIWYTYFALAPMTAACNIIYNALGYDLFSYEGPKGQSIKKALDYLLYYCKHPDEWPHYNGKQTYVFGSAGYPRNLFEAMGKIYDDASYTEFARQKEVNDVIGHHYAWTFTTLTVV